MRLTGNKNRSLPCCRASIKPGLYHQEEFKCSFHIPLLLRASLNEAECSCFRHKSYSSCKLGMLCHLIIHQLRGLRGEPILQLRNRSTSGHRGATSKISKSELCLFLLSLSWRREEGGKKASQYLKPRKQERFPGKSCSQSQHPRQRKQHLRISPAQDRSRLRHWSHSTSSQGNARTIIRVGVLAGGNANPTSVHQTQFLSLTGSNTSPCLPTSKRDHPSLPGCGELRGGERTQNSH